MVIAVQVITVEVVTVLLMVLTAVVFIVGFVAKVVTIVVDKQWHRIEVVVVVLVLAAETFKMNYEYLMFMFDTLRLMYNR